MHRNWTLDRVTADPEAADSPLAHRILGNAAERFPNIRSGGTDLDAAGPVSLGRVKRHLRIVRGKGDLVKPCPGTSAPYLCCRYTVINLQAQCPMDCTYCILQSYLNQAETTVDVRLDEVFGRIERLLASEPSRFFRFGTGELGDSLALDSLTGLSGDLLRFFAGKRNAIVELKTKTDHVDGLLAAPERRAVASWSLNPESVIRSEEFRTPDLAARLAAARRCADAGFLIGFHLDPILRVPDWETEYRELVDRMLEAVDPSRIAWISLGTLRFPPALERVIASRFPRTRICSEELVRGMDGKVRVAKPIRLMLYRKVFARIRELAPDAFAYFCMEPSDVWERVIGRAPASNADLDFWFAQSLWRRFPELGMDEPKAGDYA
jgi:spore photoproduct lyase